MLFNENAHSLRSAICLVTFLRNELNVDKKANFRYPDGSNFRLMEASTCNEIKR